MARTSALHCIQLAYYVNSPMCFRSAYSRVRHAGRQKERPFVRLELDLTPPGRHDEPMLRPQVTLQAVTARHLAADKAARRCHVLPSSGDIDKLSFADLTPGVSRCKQSGSEWRRPSSRRAERCRQRCQSRPESHGSGQSREPG